MTSKLKYKRIFVASALIYYILILVFYFVAKYVAGQHNWYFRPVIVSLFYTIFFLYPSIMIGLVILRHIKGKKVRKIGFILYFLVFVSACCIGVIMILAPTVEERRMKCGYIEIIESVWLDKSVITYAEPRALLFYESFEWDAEHEIRLLENEYNTTFTLSSYGENDFRLYYPKEHPELNIKICSYSADGVVTDYQYLLTNELVMQYYQEHNLSWDFSVNDSNNDYRKDTVFLIHDGDDMKKYADDLSNMVAVANKDKFYETNVGWLSVKFDNGKDGTLYFGNYIPFSEDGVSSDFYADRNNVLTALEKIKEGEFSYRGRYDIYPSWRTTVLYSE